MKRRNVFSSTEAVVGVVVAILLVGLVVAVMSLIQTMYVPSMMEEREAEHMEDVAEQFARLKSAIDNQIAGQHTPIATSITLGSKELPFFMSLRAFGALEIVPNNFEFLVESVNFQPDLMNVSTQNFVLSSIKFSSANGYFVDHSYIYEAGAVIISQSYGNMLYIRPSFEAVFESPGTGDILINITLVNVTGVGGKTYAAGYGTYPIQTEFYSMDTFNYENISSLTLITDHENSWSIYFKNSLFRKKLNHSAGDYSIVELDEGIQIQFSDPSRMSLTVTVVEIHAQIGPGWVEE
jgi:hypothetical protein